MTTSARRSSRTATSTRRERLLGPGARRAGTRSARRSAPSPTSASQHRRAHSTRSSARTRALRASCRRSTPRAADVAREARRAGHDHRQGRLRRRRRARPRRPRPRLRVLHQGVRPLRGPPRRRVLHARARSSGCSSRCCSPTQGRIFDPACGSCGMFIQSAKFIAAHGGKPRASSRSTARR